MKKILAILVMLAVVSIATSAMGETADDAEDCTGDQSITTCATIEDIKGIEVDFNAVNFKKIIPGEETSNVGDEIFSMNDGKPTIRNIGNTEISIKINAADMISGENNIPSSFLSVQIPGLSTEIFSLGSEATISNLAPNKPYSMIFSINAPIASKSGNYKGSISITI